MIRKLSSSPRCQIKDWMQQTQRHLRQLVANVQLPENLEQLGANNTKIDK